MPSTLVHLALAGLIAAALLGDAYDGRALLVVFAVTAFPDLDSFVALASPVGHRAAFHTFVIPVAAGLVLLADLRLRDGSHVRRVGRRLRGSRPVHRLGRRLRDVPSVPFPEVRVDDRSFVRRRWGARGVRVAWVAILCYAVAGIALDFTAGVVNPFWPIHDQFYLVEGKIELSSRRGIVQTFVELGGDSGTRGVGSTADLEPSTGVNPDREPGEPVDRVFPIARAHWHLLLIIVGGAVTAARFVVDQSVSEADGE